MIAAFLLRPRQLRQQWLACILSLVLSPLAVAVEHSQNESVAIAANPRMAMLDKLEMHQRVTQVARQFAHHQTMGYPGKVNILIQAIDSRVNIAACDQMEAFAMQGARLWGKTHIGVRCLSETSSTGVKPWVLYLQADVQVWGEYAVVAIPLNHGELLSTSHVVMQHGDLTKLPNGVVTDANMVAGKQAAMNLPLGTVLRPELLKAVAVILQGQTVQLSSRGTGFEVTTDGVAMQAANVGQVVDVKVSSGQIIKGIAQKTGKVEVGF